MVKNFLYIDPGTGSMLFSIMVGAAATLFFLFKAFWIKIKMLFSAKKDGTQTTTDSQYSDYVIYCEGKQYQSVFSPILDEFESRKIPVNYLTSVKEDEAFSKNYQFVKPEFIGEGNKAFFKLNMLNAGIVLMTTPGLNVYQLKRSKKVRHYSHIVHMTSDATMYRLFGIDYFDSILLSGDYQGKDIRTLEKQRELPQKELFTVGCTYLDYLKAKIKALKLNENSEKDGSKNFTVLVSPSWGTAAILSRFGEKLLDPLAASGFDIIIRPHPQSKKSEAETLERLQQRYKDYKNVTWDFEKDNIYSLSKADIMISDFSGIIYDYTFLFDKPVFYVNSDMDLRPYDAYDLEESNKGKNIWQFDTLRKIGIELKEEQFPQIKEKLLQASSNENLSELRKKAKAEAWMYEDESAKRTVDFMVNKIAELKNKN